MSFWVKTNNIVKRIFFNQVWDIPNTQNTIYLTFDDGPTPEITEWVLNILDSHAIPATFFCIGNNIDKHPDIFKKVIAHGHRIGNHTYNHLKGWKTNNDEYIRNTKGCEEAIIKHSEGKINTRLFRPPYGKIKPLQSRLLRKQGYQIIMWDVISMDYDKTVTPEECIQNVIQNARQGSIIVFHDSQKAFQNLEHALPKAIQGLKERGFRFDVLP
ncbi:polysaccharide deacetylase family protein [Flavobacterium cerinum]|uniref:Polysaccharide deacetylase family protein n=1 Tax=Flavobacterium cerinum TaxID=2502784 RepID=A0ABY5IV08_9FLAO|nr:polysaccharide deacetylase family protein [Flavobacterium cerinum]UUC46662.1 polysaccharide deacetylase family protein [Flavobacterium cerinum]